MNSKGKTYAGFQTFKSNGRINIPQSQDLQASSPKHFNSIIPHICLLKKWGTMGTG